MVLSRWTRIASVLMAVTFVNFLPPIWAWADVQPGDTITLENIDQAGDLLIPAVKWLVERGMPIKVGPYRAVSLPQLYRKATEKYAAAVQISPDGQEIFHYVAGLPFPDIDPNDLLAGPKIMWNHAQKPAYTDNVGTEWIAELVNSRGALEQTYGSSFWRRMMWTGRLYTKPTPVVRHHPALRSTEHLGPLFTPIDLKGAQVLTLRYLDPSQPDDTLLYVPELHRVRSLPPAQRGDAFWGTDVDLDSLWGFNANISDWRFSLVGDKEILAPVHSGKYGDHSVWCAEPDGLSGPLAFMPCGINWEKRRVWVVEGIPTAYAQYAYSKRLLYVDQEFWGMNFSETFDEGGELWKLWFNIFSYTITPYEGYPANPLPGARYAYQDEWPFTPHGMMVDMESARATKWDAPSGYAQPQEWRTEWYFNEAVKVNTEETYTFNFLVRSAH